jgi:prefoldin subunit 5
MSKKRDRDELMSLRAQKYVATVESMKNEIEMLQSNITALNHQHAVLERTITEKFQAIANDLDHLVKRKASR